MVSDLDHPRGARTPQPSIDATRADAARDYGEEISTLAYLLHEPNAAAFGRWMQTHYVELFAGLDSPPRYAPKYLTSRLVRNG